MTPDSITWVVGARGLLGRHVIDRITSPHSPTMTVSVPWKDPDAARSALRGGIDSLISAAGEAAWNIAWCAGAGVLATSQEALEQERQVFSGFLDDLARAVDRDADGALFLASSAGGVYAGSASPPFTEVTEPRPLTPYGHVKLAMEADLRAFAHRTGTPVLIGRITNLYGPGQNLHKPQGLVSQLCKAHLTGQPLSVFAPLDTRRDYLFAYDCAEMIATGLMGIRDRVSGSTGGPVVMKILASGRSTTIGGLIGESTRLFRRRPRVVLGAAVGTAGRQALDLRFESLVWMELDRHARTTLPTGLSATAEDIARYVVRPRAGEDW